MPIFLGLFIIFIIWFQYKLRHDSKIKDNDMSFSEMMKEEMITNYTRKKEISQSLFFVPEMNLLPVINYDSEQEKKSITANLQKSVIKQSEKKMIRLEKPMSNKEIKLTFGLVNLEFIAEYEENFTYFLQKLNLWGEALIKEGRLDDAESVLTECIRIGSDISKSYTLLADIFTSQNAKEKLADFRKTIENSDLLLKEKIIIYINDCIESLI